MENVIREAITGEVARLAGDARGGLAMSKWQLRRLLEKVSPVGKNSSAAHLDSATQQLDVIT